MIAENLSFFILGILTASLVMLVCTDMFSSSGIFDV